ncbi:MAG: hypothetical protein PWP21_1615 [Thermosediminibacterales bacterium]|nr:hypothetical protein [Thermosediminibacterales bacterium]
MGHFKLYEYMEVKVHVIYKNFLVIVGSDFYWSDDFALLKIS